MDKLEAENAALKAELAALKPKPVDYKVCVRPMGVDKLYFNQLDGNNLKLTFVDGVLTHAEVLRDK